MSDYKLKDVVLLIGIAAIVATLVFVGLELRQNRALAEAAAYQAGMESAATPAAQEQQILPEAKPPFTSTADTVFDIIRVDDPSTFSCLEYVGREERQVWDKRVDGEPVINNFVFNSRYDDGTSIKIALNPEFGTVAAARDEASRYVTPLGQLPSALRSGIRWLSIHKGREGFHAGDEQIIMYSEMTDDRLGYNHLEESVFHEAVHASWDAKHRLSEGWKKAQESDRSFMSRYAARSPEREDLAETALFAFALIHHPDRMPPADSADIRKAVPARIDYITGLLPPGSPLHYRVGPAGQCASNPE